MPQSPRWGVRWWEPFTALGIGTVINLVISLAATAGALPPAVVDRDGFTMALAGAAGGLVSALLHAAVICLGAEAPTRTEIVRAIIEGVFAVVVGSLCAGYLSGPFVNRLLAAASASDLRAVGFGVGMLAWRIAPGVLGAAKLLSDPAQLRDLALRWLGGLGGRTGQ